MKRYMTDRWFSRIVGPLGRSYFLRKGDIYIVLIHDGFELNDLKVA